MDFDPVMPQYDADMLRQSASLPPHSVLPAKLEQEYWNLKRCHDRVGLRLDLRAIVFLCYQLGYGNPNAKESAPPTVVELFRAKKLKVDDPVLATWRNKKTAATFKGINARGEVVVQLEGDSQTRNLAVDKVEAVELVTA